MERIFTRRTVETCQLKHMRNGFSLDNKQGVILKNSKGVKK
jgi:hypothetical protein